MDAFRLYLTRKGLKGSTIDSIVERVGRVFQNCTPFSEATFNEYVYTLQEKNTSTRYVNKIIASLLHYKSYRGDGLEWLTNALYLPEKRVLPARAVMTPDEINTILKCHRTRNQTRQRHDLMTLFFETLAVTGCRPSEVASLGDRKTTPNYVDFGNGVLVLQETKTDPRVVPLPERIVERFKAIQGRSDYFFRRVTVDAPIRDTEWGYEFHSRCRRCGIDRKYLSVYSFRVSYITEMSSETDVFSLMSLVGHREATTTQQYYRSNLKKLKIEAKKHPLLKSGMTLEEVVEMLDDLVKKINAVTSVKADISIQNVPDGRMYRLKVTH